MEYIGSPSLGPTLGSPAYMLPRLELPAPVSSSASLGGARSAGARPPPPKERGVQKKC